MHALDNPLAFATLLLAFIAASIIGWYLTRRPMLTTVTKIVLLFGILVFPVGAAVTGNAHGLSASMSRDFCSSCHVMTPYTDDSKDPLSHSLAAQHAKNKLFGDHNCYSCHSDYGMVGTVLTKINGMHHVYEYYLNYRTTPIEEALGKMELYKPFNNGSCLQCHSTETKRYTDVRDHRGAEADVRSGKLSCASEGCHGPAHPFSKEVKKKKLEVSAQ